MTYDPNQPQPSPFPAPEPGPVAGQPSAYPGQPPAPAPGQPTYASPGQPTYGSPGQPGPRPQQGVPSFIPPSVASAVVNPKRGGASAGTMAFVVAVVIAGAGLGFAGGRLTAPAAATPRGQFAGNFAGGGFTPNASGNPARGGFGGAGGAFGGTISIDGQVTAVANGTITIQTANGQSVTLEVPSTATYHAQAPASASDVTVGSKIQVSASRAGGRAEASGQPGQGGAFGFTVNDITVLGK